MTETVRVTPTDTHWRIPHQRPEAEEPEAEERVGGMSPETHCRDSVSMTPPGTATGTRKPNWRWLKSN